MNTLIDEDLDTFDLTDLDWDFAPPCDAHDDDGNGCDNTAEYIIVLSCCAKRLLLCEECLFGIVEWLKRMPLWRTMKCPHCDTILWMGPGHVKVIGRIQ